MPAGEEELSTPLEEMQAWLDGMAVEVARDQTELGKLHSSAAVRSAAGCV